MVKVNANNYCQKLLFDVLRKSIILPKLSKINCKFPCLDLVIMLQKSNNKCNGNLLFKRSNDN